MDTSTSLRDTWPWKHVLVVEAHPDDAFLSLGWHLATTWDDCAVTILTVFADGQRAREAREYAYSMQAESICLNLVGGRMNSTRPIQLIPQLQAKLQRLRKEHDVVLFPIGLQHPDHLCVAATAEDNDLRYLDIPYCCKQKLHDEMLDKVAGMQVVSIAWPGKKKWQSANIFKSQSKFFYYNKALVESNTAEIVLCNPPRRENSAVDR